MNATTIQNRLVPWFGSDLSVAEDVGRLLGDLKWCGVPFCGGCSALPYIRTTAGVASDKHLHVINLARVIRDPAKRRELSEYLSRTPFHEQELIDAQSRCLNAEGDIGGAWSLLRGQWVRLAADYYVCCWMARGGHSGKATEFKQGPAVRFTSSGGSSAKRWTSAVESLEAWSRSLRPWEFVLSDAFDVIQSTKDDPRHGLYVDPPWPELGNEYAHKFTESDHRRLAAELLRFKRTRVLIRYGEHPLIRELYPASHWMWYENTTRNQKNNEVREVLIGNF